VIEELLRIYRIAPLTAVISYLLKCGRRETPTSLFLFSSLLFSSLRETI